MSHNSEDYSERLWHDVQFAADHRLRDLFAIAIMTPLHMIRSIRRRDFA